MQCIYIQLKINRARNSTHEKKINVNSAFAKIIEIRSLRTIIPKKKAQSNWALICQIKKSDYIMDVAVSSECTITKRLNKNRFNGAKIYCASGC